MSTNRFLKRNPLVLEHSPQNDQLRQELLNMRFEYEKLFNIFQRETQETSRLKVELDKEKEFKHLLEAKLAEFENVADLKEIEVVLIKKLRADNKKFQETIDIKSIEIK